MNRQDVLDYLHYRMQRPIHITDRDVLMMEAYFRHIGKPHSRATTSAAFKTTGTFYIDKLMNKLIEEFDIKVITESLSTFDSFVSQFDKDEEVIRYE